MAAPNLNTLPAALLQIIVNHITRPSDLQRLARVSQVWNQHASASLYRDSYIDLSVPPGSSAFFQDNHPCHPYVRGLHFYETGAGLTNVQRCTVALAALALIPNDNLLRLTFPLHMVVSQAILREMCLNQRTIITLAIGLTNGALAALWEKEDAEFMDSLLGIEALTVPNAFPSYNDQRDLVLWNHIMRNQEKLRSLELAPTIITLPPGATINAKALFDELFWRASADPPPLALESLTLRGFDFTRSIAAITRAIDFSHLTTLAVTNMEHNAAFFNALAAILRRQSRYHITPKLKKLHLSTIDRTDSIALTAVLMACTDLRELQIKAVGSYMTTPTVASITKHAATLRVFGFGVLVEHNMNLLGGNVYVLNQGIFSCILNHLVHLEELSVNLGMPVLGREGENDHHTRVMIQRLVRLAQRCPSLRALRLLKWPMFSASTDEDVVHNPGLPIDRASIAALRNGVFKEMQKMAQDVFQVNDAAPNRPVTVNTLRVLVIGSPNWPCWVDHVLNPTPPPNHYYLIRTIPNVVYARRELMDADGVRTTVALTVNREDLEYDDRKFAIFEYGT
ncbi:hypothetical protein LTR95_011539 [Oleoguttula sp. CCFEE 5521]